MKRLAFGGLIGAIIATAIAYWHVVGQIEDRLETLAGRVAPVGQLSWSSIRVDPRGRASIEALRFQPHNQRDRLSLERLTVDAGGLRALLQLDRVLDSGRLPAALSVAAEGLSLPVNQQVDTWLAAFLPPQAWIAAGCPSIDPFRYYNLGELGWWDLTIDAQLSYQYLELAEQLELRGRVQVHHLVEGRLSADLSMPPEGLALDRNDPIAESAALNRARVTVTNRGFYERLLDYCANLTGLTRDQFRSAHLESWDERWQAFGLQPGNLVLAGYRHFLGQPDTLSVALNPEPALGLAEITQRFDPLWRRLGARFSINGGTDIEFRVDETLPVPAPASAETPPPEPADENTQSPIPGRTFGPAPQWQLIDLDRAGEYIGARIRLELIDGSLYSGHLISADGTSLHLSIRNRLGEIVRPLPRAEIARVEIRP